MNICQLSGNLLKHPVISKKSGLLFEKELILEHIKSTGQCPVTGSELSQHDLIEIQPANGAKNKNLHSILNKIQNEWDTLQLENFTIKNNLQEIRNETMKNLYQHEAARLVICRLIKERDESVKLLNFYKSQIEELKLEMENHDDEEFDNMGIYSELLDRINELSTELVTHRKKREISKELMTADLLKQYKVKGSYPLHSASKPGVTCLDIHPFRTNMIITGGVDARTVIFDITKECELFSLEKAHLKRINQVKFFPSLEVLGFTVASSDNTASFWLADSDDLTDSVRDYKFGERYKTSVHAGAVTSLSFHPLKEYCLFASRDAHWSFHNLIKGVCLAKIGHEDIQEISKAEIHPDGSIFGTGESNGLIRLWDINSQAPVVSIEAHKNEVSGLSFSENGFYLATSGMKDKSVNIIDLRKSQIIKKIQLGENIEVRSVRFDNSGIYLGIVGTAIHLYNVKSGNIFAEFDEHSDLITDINFSKNCDYFATTSLDRNLKIFSI